ncbi:Tad domain-containing protein [Halopseudomonas nanhaiensis]|uniref:Tad domain-containing protein n=1 Tax=Halopseudomonas nanhaiensis TaxID=2830842 RepID=UPI001CBF43A7|nr:Tad domain-containing protein [Halopseudomonas nanhaiensis]UAW99497.1 Tad domain-containing protein [Halopseudomonas nanhaiensis]
MSAMLMQKNQDGYATIFTILLFAVMGLAAFSMFDSGQVAAERVRLQNTSDAAAYSAASLLARDYNFTAYTNRAMIANQAAIGQLVAINSWTHYLEQEAINLDTAGTIAQVVPGIGQAIKAVTNAVRMFAERLSDVVVQVTGAGVGVLDEYIYFLSKAQQIYHEAAYFSSMEATLAIIKQNDSDVEFGLVQTLAGLAKYSDRWQSSIRKNEVSLGQGRESDSVNRSRFREKTALVVASRDRFTADRATTWMNHRSFAARIQMRKRGATEFDMDDSGDAITWDWTSLDTESLWIALPRISRFRIRYRWRETMPVGWGAAHALDEGSDHNYFSRRQCAGNRCYNTSPGSKWGNAWENRWAATLGASNGRGNNLSKINGLRDYRDFETDRDPRFSGRAPAESSQSPGVTVHLAKKSSNISTSQDQLQSGSGTAVAEQLNIDSSGSLPTDRIVSVATAESYFSRPTSLWPRADRRLEHGNLYNPYWQPRLTEVSPGSRLIAAQLATGSPL